MNDIQTVIKNSNDLFINLIDNQSFNQIIDQCKAYYNARNKYPKFIFSGVGKNWYICEKVVKTYISMGLNAVALDCTHALHGDLGVINAGEPSDLYILFFISKSGTTEEMIKLAKIINTLNAESRINPSLIMVSLSFNKSEEYDYLFNYNIHPTIDTKVLEFDDRNLVPTMSINTLQSTLDYLGVCLFENSKELVEKYKYNHLGGNNGKILGGDKFMEGCKS